MYASLSSAASSVPYFKLHSAIQVLNAAYILIALFSHQVKTSLQPEKNLVFRITTSNYRAIAEQVELPHATERGLSWLVFLNSGYHVITQVSCTFFDALRRSAVIECTEQAHSDICRAK